MTKRTILLVTAALALATPVLGKPAAPTAPVAPAEDITLVRVERVRPKKPKVETLRFLKDNREFIRSRFDALRLTTFQKSGLAGEIDPRFLRYPELLASIYADRDSVRGLDDAWKRRQLLARIAELGTLEDQLDAMDRLLAEQRTRLGILQDDFTGDQRTALIVVVSGDPAGVPLTEVTVALEDGSRLTVPLNAGERETLRQGGVVQVFHGFVEPREQVIEVALAGDGWPPHDSGFVTLTPERNRLTLLRLDLSHVNGAAGATGIQGSTWLHDTKLPIGG